MAEARSRNAAARSNVSPTGLAASRAWYSRYRVISHSRPRSGRAASTGSGSDRQVQAAIGPAPGLPGVHCGSMKSEWSR